MSSKRIKGITIEINGDTTKLSKSLREVDKTISETAGKLRDVQNLLKFNPTSSELLKQKQEALGQEINATKEKLNQEKKALAELEKSADGSKENKEQQEALKREIIATTGKLEALEKQAKKAASVFGTQMQEAGKKIAVTGDKIMNVGKSLSKLSAGFAAVSTAAIKVTADFDTSMSKVAAVSGATGEDFTALRDKAREMGATTMFSASEAADAMNYMAMAGWKTEDMLNGISGIMNLAAASGEDLATTSDIVTDALTAFGQSTEESGRLADIMAAASSNANTNVKMMGETFKYAAPVAGALGATMEDSALAIALMANAGIKSSQAGTAMRTGLTNLVKPTDQMAAAMKKYGIELQKNEDGSINLRETIKLLRTNLGGLSQDEQAAAAAAIFGKNSMSGWLAVINASEGDFNKISDAIDNSDGSAQKMADTMQDNLTGQTKILKSQLEEAAIVIGDSLMPSIRDLVDFVQKLVDKFNKLDPKQKNLISKMIVLGAAIGPVAIGIGAVTKGVGNFITGIGKTVSAISSLLVKLGLKAAATTADTTATAANTAAAGANTVAQGTATAATTASGTAATGAATGFTALNASMLLIPLAVIAIVAALVVLIKHWDEVVAGVKKGIEKIKTFFSNLKEKIQNTFKGIGKWFGEKFTEAWTNIKKAFKNVSKFFGGIWEKIKGKFEDLGTKIGDTVGGAFKGVINGVLDKVEDMINFIPSAVNTFLDVINTLPGVDIPSMDYVDLPRLAKGGMTTEATAALIGDNKSHNEAVLPLDDPRTVKLFREALSGVGSGGTVNQTINVGQMSSYKEAYMIRRATEQGLKKMMRVTV